MLIVGIVLVLSTVGSLMVQKQISQTETAAVNTQPESKTTARLVYITGGGASFINPQMQAWIRVFMEKTGGTISINYQSIGSGAGEAKWLEGALDFGASDIAISKTGYEKLKE
ncbi:MAG: substrate-binding domain-containing protein, partial [Sulfolobales archaeon]